MKKFTKNNKGFSLVELIVVIAIMAVLMAVLVPTLVKNVEKSRVQTDKSALAELRQATITALADDKFALAGTTDGVAVGTDGVLTIASLFKDDTEASKGLATEVESIIGSKTIKLKSGIVDGNCKVKLDITAREGLVTLTVTSDKHNFKIDASGESAVEAATK